VTAPAARHAAITDIPLSVDAASSAFRSGDLTSVALTEAMLGRIKALNGELGAYICTADEIAIAEAKAADSLIAAGNGGPLTGIPYATKDIVATRDLPTTANSHVLDRAWGDGYDAPVVARMRAAGAVHLGKLVLSEFALGLPDPENGFPVPCNPWNTAHSAAGSSSGTGIAIAAGLAMVGFGTDTGGSIRGPAAYNGVSGIKPTFGRVPKAGCVPLGYSLDNIGPLARSARDCALMLQVIAGYDASDPCAADVPVPDFTAELTGDLSGIRIGIPTSYFFDAPGLEREVKASVENAIADLRKAGAVVTEVDLPHAEEAKDANMVILFSEAFAYHRQDLASRYDEYGKFTAPTLARGALFTGSDYVQAQRFRTYWRKKVASVMEHVDLLVTPTMPTPAPAQADMTPETFMKLPSFMGQWNLTGLPALAVPCGFSESGLPISMQLIGHAFAEATVLRAGDAYQRLTDWHLRLPPV
jgi:aspartyl-tRNA(Asn)/glutamyl-tRNA(Gln) amidotransferase subunit A